MSTISNAPTILKDFLSYHETVKAHSAKTVDEYFLDLRTFIRYLKRSRGLVSPRGTASPSLMWTWSWWAPCP